MSEEKQNQHRKGKPFFRQSDSQKMIEYCLRCPWTKCWNCLGLHNAYSVGLRLELGERQEEQ